MNADWRSIGVDVRGRTSGRVWTTCPFCAEQHPKNKQKRCMQVNLDTDGYWCQRCETHGFAPNPAKRAEFLRQQQRLQSYRPMAPNPLGEVLNGEVYRYLTEDRGLSPSVLENLKIRQQKVYLAEKKAETWVMVFNFMVEGKVVNVKYRSVDKIFTAKPGGRSVPFNIDSAKGQKKTVIVEGELDVPPFLMAGITSVLSVPNGANGNTAYLDDFIATHFDDKEIIYLATDNDAPGMKCCEELIRRFGEERCRVVKYPEGCKDAGEVLKAYGVEGVKQLLTNAEPVPLLGVYTAEDDRDDLWMLFNNGLGKAASCGFENLDRYLTVEPGRLMVLTGYPGDGKSEFVDMLTVNWNLKHGWKTVFFSPENEPRPYHWAKLIEKFTGRKFHRQNTTQEEYRQVTDYISRNFIHLDPKGDYRIQTLLHKTRELIRRHSDVRVLVIDPYNRMDHSEGDDRRETSYINDLLRKLSNFAREMKVLVVLVAHPRKPFMDMKSDVRPVPQIYDISGSANFKNVADYGVIVYRDYKRNLTKVVVEKVRMRNQGEPGECYFKFNKSNGRYVEVPGTVVNSLEEYQPFWDSTNWLQRREHELTRQLGFPFGVDEQDA